MKRVFYGIMILLAGLALAHKPAWALPMTGDLINVKYNSFYGDWVHIDAAWNGGSFKGTVGTGIYKLSVDGVPMDSFCIDLADLANKKIALYQVVALQNAADPPFGPMGEEKASYVSKLWNMGYDQHMSREAAAGLQLAIWEVLTEDLYSWDILSGSFKAKKSGSAFLNFEAIRDHAEKLLNDLAEHPHGTQLVALTHPKHQDFVVPGHPVNEPSALLLFGAGLLGASLLQRRRMGWDNQ